MNGNITLGRFRVVTDGALASPGKCSVCGTTSGSMIDWGMESDFYGVVYICVDTCFREIATILDYYSAGQVEHIKEQFENLTEAQTELVAYNKELENAVSALTDLRIIAPDGINPDQLSFDFSVEKDTDAESGTNEGADSGNVKPRARKERSIKQTDEQGSGSVHHDDSIEQLGL